nr:DUF5304 family protein [Streptomyces sp. NRRL F-5053]
MSDDPENPERRQDARTPGGADAPGPDPDAWAAACEEDLEAEKARRRAAYGPEPVSAAEELRRLADAVTEKFAELGGPFARTVGSAAAQGVAQQLFSQARSAIEPVIARNPQVFDHLAAAGGELLAAYRAAVQESETRWTRGPDGRAAPERVDLDERADADAAADDAAADEGTAPGTSAEDSRAAEHADLGKGADDEDAGPGRGAAPEPPRRPAEHIDLDADGPAGPAPGTDSGADGTEGPDADGPGDRR